MDLEINEENDEMEMDVEQNIQQTPISIESENVDAFEWLKSIRDTMAMAFLTNDKDFDTTASKSKNNESSEAILNQMARDLLSVSFPTSSYWSSSNFLNFFPAMEYKSGNNIAEISESMHHLFTRLIHFQSMLQMLAPISMDLAVRISDIVQAENTDDQNGNASFSKKGSQALISSLVLFGNWLPLARHLDQIARDLFQTIVSGKNMQNVIQLYHFKEIEHFIFVQGVHRFCAFYQSRQDVSCFSKMSTWGELHMVLNQYTIEADNRETTSITDINGDVEMTNKESTVDAESIHSSEDIVKEAHENYFDANDGTLPYAIKWHIARAISSALNLRPNIRTTFLQRIHVRNEKPTFQIDFDVLREQFHIKMRNNTIFDKIQIWPHPKQLRSVISLHSSLVDIDDGVTLPKWSTVCSNDNRNKNQNETYQRLVLTKTTKENLSLLSLALCEDPYPPPILVCGPQGSGKSSLIREFAHLCDANLLELHLDEETDSKTLLGTYTATDIPGEFIWRPGALTRAAREGRWVLLEDADVAPQEILDALLPLLENRILPLPKERERVHPKFRLFGTITTVIPHGSKSHREDLPFHGGLGGRRLLQSGIWRKVHVDPLTFSELGDIARKLYPTLPLSVVESCLGILRELDASGRLENSVNTISEMEEETRMDGDVEKEQQEFTGLSEQHQQRKMLAGGRSASVRDFRKLCNRIASLIPFESLASFATESQRMLCLSESYDVFCASCPTIEGRRFFVTEFAARIWQISHDLSLKYLEARKPTIGKKTHVLQVGRGILPVNVDIGEKALMKLQNTGNTSKFAPTPHALRLMESIAVSISRNEPTLLVGETGCGKTTLVQRLAASSNQELIVQNLSLQTDSTDLLGGYRPVELKHLARRLYVDFIDLFVASFSREKNKKFLDYIHSAYEKGQWKRLSQCFIRGANMGKNKICENMKKSQSLSTQLDKWNTFFATANKFERQRVASDSGLAFAFTEGALVQAIRTGKWVLLDEINLASSETLLRLCGLLDDAQGSVILAERGDSEALERHPNFRLIAAMNPATDVAKKDLPASMRSRFTEFYVDELTNSIELRTVAARYLSEVVNTSEINLDHSEIIIMAVDVYLKCRELSEETLVDGGGQRPRYTLRTLCRALSASRDLVLQQKFSIKRALLEGFELAFEGPLDDTSRNSLRKILSTSLGKGLSKKELAQPMRRPGKEEDYLLLKPFWIKTGSIDCIDWANSTDMERTGRSKFVLTKSALTHLRRLSRAVASGPWPVLLEGPTSSGKTTLVEYLAARCGHRCIRINNHEHTDVQEYTGSYIADSNGALVFKEGLLVQALRRGDWIILDELNLAPSEVLEALNRLLDDNRELFLPEINETIVAGPSFRLFATQNPCGAYGGRKPLSRAFRNRFVEVHVGDIPSEEMINILQFRCGCPPSHAKLLVKVMITLRQRRSKSGVFQGKDSLITPRDLLRWAERGGMAKRDLALEGYMLLAERLRDNEEKHMVKEIIESTFRVNIDEDDEYYGVQSGSRQDLLKVHKCTDGSESLANVAGLSLQSIAPTSSLLRMLCLVKRCVQQKEPVLLVGDTGCGKTTVVQLLSILLKRKLHVINCHASTETSDILGGLRPMRGREAILSEIIQKVKEILSLFSDDLSLVLKRIDVPQFLGQNEAKKQSNDHKLEIDLNVKFESNIEENLPQNAATESLSFVKTLLASCVMNSYQSEKDNAKRGSPVDGKTKKKKNKRRKLESGATKTIQDCELKGIEKEIISENCYNSIKRIFKEITSLHERYVALFEWVDGPLVEAMRVGNLLLLDEMSLAEDAVLERLNSVLEPSRRLVLAEKGGGNQQGYENNEVCANENFLIFATMNPGGDFGKRELSPALRSRFTEIWIPAVTSRQDIDLVLQGTFSLVDKDSSLHTHIYDLQSRMLDYVEWFNNTVCENPSFSCTECSLSLRDILAWTRFIIDMSTKSPSASVWMVYVHGAALMHLDGLGIGTAGLAGHDADRVRHIAKDYLRNQVPKDFQEESMVGFHNELIFNNTSFIGENSDFGIHPFYISLGSESIPKNINFNLSSPTTNMNLRRVLRGLQLSKPILLEGSPGVGKTSLISALASASGHKLVRINLSEQTDISDLMGTDLPIPEDTSSDKEKDSNSSNSALFRWYDGVFLQALKQGDWVLLDELNLATQSVLEGLNSCLDHRAQVYIPELGKTINCPPSFRIFAAQNPLGQGGGRKGLPKSFLNRFTKVYVEALKPEDLKSIVINRFPTIEEDLVEKMVTFNSKVQSDVVDKRQYGQHGSPWEFNLRDIFRWCELMVSEGRIHNIVDAGEYVDTIYVRRLRTIKDREMLIARYEECFGTIIDRVQPLFNISSDHVQIGNAFLRRKSQDQIKTNATVCSKGSELVKTLYPSMEAVARCINMNWPCLLVGCSSSGKSTVLRTLAESCNVHLEEVAMTSSSDVSELIGCFEQIDTIENEKRIISLFKSLFQTASQVFEVGRNDLVKLCSLHSVFIGEINKNESKETVNNSIFTDTSLRLMCKKLLHIYENLIQFNKAFEIIASKTVHTTRNLFESMQKNDEKSCGLFRWVDGILVTAMEQGYWLHLENVNFCPSSVLDRLNPLMESGGELVLTECGVMNEDLKPRAIVPNPNFRLFLSMNPNSGEVSRAMRNRCIEICLISPDGSELLDSADHIDDQSTFVTTQTFDAQDSLERAGIKSSYICANMIRCHKNECNYSEKLADGLLTLRDLKAWGKMSATLMERGMVGDLAFPSAFCLLYGYSKHSIHSNIVVTTLPILSAADQNCQNKSINFEQLWLADPCCAKALDRLRLYNLGTKVKSKKMQDNDVSFQLKLLNANMSQTSSHISRYENFYLDSSRLSESRSNLLIHCLARYLSTSSYKDWILRVRLLSLEPEFEYDSVHYVMTLINHALVRFKLKNEIMNIENLLFDLFDQPFDFRDNIQFFNNINLDATNKFVGNAKPWIKSVEVRLNYIRLRYLMRLPQLLREQITYNQLEVYEDSEIDLNQKSPLELSYLFNAGKVDRSIMNCSITPLIYPLFEAVDNLLHILDISFSQNIESIPEETSGLSCLLSSRDRIWVCLTSTKYCSNFSSSVKFDQTGLLIQWKWLKKALASFFQLISLLPPEFFREVMVKPKRQLELLTSKIDETLFETDVNTILSDLLWKNGGHPLVPACANGWGARESLRKLAKSQCIITEEKGGLTSLLAGMCSQINLDQIYNQTHGCLYFESGMKIDILAALCTAQASITDEVRSLHMDSKSMEKVSSTSIANFFAKRLIKSRDKFTNLVKSTTIDTSINTIENQYDIEDLRKLQAKHIAESENMASNYDFIDDLLQRWSYIQSTQPAEISCLHEELDLIGHISTLLLNTKNGKIHANLLQEIVLKSKKFIEDVTTHTLWPVSDLRPYQTLIWSIEGPPLSLDNFQHLLKCVLPIMSFTAGNHIWCNSFNTLDIIGNVLRSPPTWKKENNEENEPYSYSLSRIRQVGNHNFQALYFGPYRLNQPVRTAAILRLAGLSTDINAIVSPCPHLTIENYGARRKQAQMLMSQLVRFKEVKYQQHIPLTMKRLLVDVLESLHDYIPYVDELLSIVLCPKGLSKSVDRVKDIVKQCTYLPFQKLVPSAVLPLLDLMTSIERDHILGKLIAKDEIAKSWILIGLIRINLLLPSTPIDPGRKPAAKVSQWDDYLTDLGTRLTVLKLESRILTGDNVPNTFGALDLLKEAERASEKRNIQTKKIVERSKEAASFLQLYRELHRFSKTTCAVKTITDIMHQILGSKSKAEMRAGRVKEVNWQSSVCSFCHRLINHYRHYEDVTIPFINAVRNVQQGLRELACIFDKIFDDKKSSFDSMINAQCLLLQYPFGRIEESRCMEVLLPQRSLDILLAKQSDSCDEMAGHINNFSKSTRISLLFAALSRMEIYIRTLSCSDDNMEYTDNLSKLFSIAVESWMQQEQQVMLSKDSGNGTDITEEQRLENEYRKQFPDHGKEFRNIVVAVEDNDEYLEEDNSIDSAAKNSTVEFSEEHISLLCLIHRKIYDKHDRKAVDNACRIRAFFLGYKASGNLIPFTQWHMDESCEQLSIGAHMMGLSLGTNICRFTNGTKFMSEISSSFDDSQILDFHHDANPDEALKAQPVLRSLLNRVSQLLSAFPGHPALLAVGQVAEYLTRFDLKTISIGKALAGLEIILRKAQEWEQHASELVVLGDALTNVSRLVTQWRKLELSSWPSLLDIRERNHVHRARKHWPRLYKLLLGEFDKFCDSCKEVSAKNVNYLVRESPHWVWKGLEKVLGKNLERVRRTNIILCSELTKVMDGFLLSCSTGEFPERLQLLSSFANELMAKCAQKNFQHPEHLMFARTFISLSEHYAQFLPIITVHRDELREPIERKLKDEVKLAKWDDQTYYSLAESTEKSHFKLMRFLKEYDEVLEWRVNQILEKNFLHGVRSSSESESEVATSIPSSKTLFPHISSPDLKEKVDCSDSEALNESAWIELKETEITDDKYLVGMNKYFKKILKVMDTFVFPFDSNAKRGAIVTTDLSEAIFERIKALSDGKVSTPMKQRALVDLFKTLKKQGYSSMKFSVSPEIQEARFLLQLPVPCIGENDFILKDGESYFKRSIVELSRLRTEISVFGSQFMSQRETGMMLGFSDHGLSMLCQQRCLLSILISSINKVDGYLSILDEIGYDSIPMAQTSLSRKVTEFDLQYNSTMENLQQLLLLLKTTSSLSNDKSTTSQIYDITAILESGHGLLESLNKTHASVKNDFFVSNMKLNSIINTKKAILSIQKMFDKCKNISLETNALPAEIFLTCETELESLLALANSCIIGKKHNGKNVEEKLMAKTMKTISSLVEGSMLTVQGICKKNMDSFSSKEIIEKSKEIEETIWECHMENARDWALTNLSRTQHNLKLLLDQMKHVSDSSDFTSHDIEVMLKSTHNASLMVKSVLRACKTRLKEFMRFYRSSSKLLYILLRVFRNLVAKGFCVDNSEEEDGEGEGDTTGMNFEDDVEGTGMGEGEGKNDVTDQIENEEQLLGLKDDNEKEEEQKQEQKQLDEEEAETGMEMEGDFEGDMYDMPDKKEGDDEAEDDNEEEELEREMGDESSPNEEVVDEKMWDEDEDDDESPQEEEKFEEDSKMKGDQTTEEYRTKDDEDEGKSDEKAEDKEGEHTNENDKNKNDLEEQEGKDGEEEENHTLNEDLEENYEENHAGVDVREDENGEENEEGDDMDLNDELDLDDSEDVDGDKDKNDEDGNQEEIDEEMDDVEGNQGEPDEEMGDENEDATDEDAEAITASAQASGDADQDEPDKEDSQDEEENEKEDENPQVNIDQEKDQGQENAHGISADNGTDTVDLIEEEEKEDPEEDDEGNGMDEDAADGAEGEEEENKGKGNENDDGGDGDWKSNKDTEEGNGSEKKNKKMDAPNPFRDPGDVEKFWHKKLNMIEDSDETDETSDQKPQSEENDADQNNESAANNTYEFTKEGQSSTSQVLGSTMEDDVKQLDQNMNNDSDNEDVNMENEEKLDETNAEDEREEKPNDRGKEKRDSSQPKQEKASMDSNQNEEKRNKEEINQLDPSEEESTNSENASVGSSSCGDNMEDNEEMDDAENKVVTDLEQLRLRNNDDLQSDLPNASNSFPHRDMMEMDHTTTVTNEEMVAAREHWVKLQAETNNMSRRLCEKLRLVMEPLLATKLRGDYRTGKRINMKRVIGFIASGYRKDKIWLKRTKPSKRDYRVLLAVDDSESMLKSGAGEMALATLATMANGMSQLEIGELGIASFGEEMRLLHPFGQQFTSENGAHLVSSFKFDEKRTRTALCVESAMTALENAGGSSSLQLVFIISDGRIERDSRTKMRRLVREMSERNILLVMIIVEGNSDGKKKKDSIVNMKEVSFENGKPKVKYFIEDYPFPYYIVLEEMNSLPEVMGDALRQWFEMLSQIQNQGA